MTRPVYPVLPGWAFSVLKTPQFATRTQKSVSGRELRLVDQLYPTYEFTLNYGFLRDNNDTRQAANTGLGDGYNELRTLMGFFIQQQGSFAPFLFDDPTDDKVTGGFIGTGDGTTVAFQLTRAMGNFFEPMIAVKGVTQVYLNGTPATPGTWAVDIDTGLLYFGTAPIFGQAITADFTYYFLCRFKEDTLEFENFMYQLWEAKEVKLRSVLNESLVTTPAQINWDYLNLPPTDGNPVFSWVAGVTTSLLANMAGSYVYSREPATASAGFQIKVNGIFIASFTFPADTVIAAFGTSSQFALNPGDVLTVVPTSSDATLSGLTGVFVVGQ